MQSHTAVYFLARPKKNELIAVYHNKDKIYVWIDSCGIYSAFWKIKGTVQTHTSVLFPLRQPTV